MSAQERGEARASLLLRGRLRVRQAGASLAGLPPLRWVHRTGRSFLRDHGLLRASALTYSTLLAVVPLLAVMLALLKGAGFDSHLRLFLQQRIQVLDPESLDQLMDYIGAASAQTVGGVGLVALLFCSWAMLGNIEDTMNHIFGASRARGYMRRTGEYLSMLIVGALMIVLSIVLQTVLGSPALLERVFGDRLASGAARLGVGLLPWLSVWVGLAFLYAWMPNKRVPARAAFLGAILGGTFFQLLQLGYIEAQLGFARYHAIYGALAQLPILLVWIYLSWVVVLIGAEGAASLASLGVRERPLSGAGGLTDLPPGLLALLALREVGDAFRAGRPTPRPDELAARLGTTVHVVREALEPLERDGILVEPDSERGYLPGAALSAISLERVLEALGDGGKVSGG